MMAVDKVIWDFLKSKGLNDFAVAGIMGNLYAESGLIPNNLQDLYNASLGMSDEQYTAAVDSGAYTNFVYDQAGYGLAQWTYWSRKRNLLDYAKKTGKSIGDLEMQLEYLWDELQDFSNVLIELRNAQSIRAASNVILNEFEIPYDRGPAVQNYRAEQGVRFYNMFAGSPVSEPVIPEPQPQPTSPEKETDQQYCVIGYLLCPDKITARQKLSDFQASGFQGFITIADP